MSKTFVSGSKILPNGNILWLDLSGTLTPNCIRWEVPVFFLLIPTSFTRPRAFAAFGEPCSHARTNKMRAKHGFVPLRTGVGAACSIHHPCGHVLALGMRGAISKICSFVMVNKSWNSCLLLALKPHKILSTFHQHHTRSNKHTTRHLFKDAMEIPFKLGSQIWCGGSNPANWTDSGPGPLHLKGAGYSASPAAQCRRSRKRRTGASASQSENLQGLKLLDDPWWFVDAGSSPKLGWAAIQFIGQKPVNPEWVRNLSAQERQIKGTRKEDPP